jgi:hypothetical protein
MRKSIYSIIIIGLLFLSIASFYLGSGNIEDFFNSLSTNLLGILITLIGVEGIIRLHEKRVWRKVDSKILEDILLISIGLIGRINDSLSIPNELFDINNLKSSDPHMRNQVLVVFLQEKMTDDLILEKTNSANDRSILKAEFYFLSILNEYNSLLNTFGSRFQPKILNPLLDIKRTLFTTVEFIRSYKKGAKIFEVENVNFNAHFAGRIASLRNCLISLLNQLNNEIDYNKLKETET